MSPASALRSLLPNALSLLRAALVFPIWLALLVPAQLGYASALLLFVIAALSDLVDGWLARSLGATTKLGATLDALADKILVVGALAALASHHRLDRLAFAAFLVIAAREAIVALMRVSSLATGRAIPPSLVARTKTLVQMAGVAALLGVPFAPWLSTPGAWLLAAGAGLGLVSGLQYLLKPAGERTP